MQIAETNLTFSGTPKKRASTKRVIVHHSASGDVSAATIHGWHRGQGWLGIGYQFVIRSDGTIERGRAEWSIGSHSGPGANGDSIGVCLTGDFTKHPPAEQQMLALVELIKYLRGKYGNLSVIGHKDVMATACPGHMFAWTELHKRLEGTNMADKWKKDLMSGLMAARLVNDYSDPDEPAPKWWIAAVVLNLYSRMFEELKKREGK